MTVGTRPTKRRNLPRLAIIGCGAAAQEFCLPALARFPNYRSSIVAVDCSVSRAESVANQYGLQHRCADYQSLPIEVDAAIVTTPHHLHAEQAIHFLRQGKPVFVEKPLGVSAAEVTQMIAAAQAGALLR